jgi:hypothetical protein
MTKNMFARIQRFGVKRLLRLGSLITVPILFVLTVIIKLEISTHHIWMSLLGLTGGLFSIYTGILMLADNEGEFFNGQPNFRGIPKPTVAFLAMGMGLLFFMAPFL